MMLVWCFEKKMTVECKDKIKCTDDNVSQIKSNLDAWIIEYLQYNSFKW